MSWIEKILPKAKSMAAQKRGVPEGVWCKCTSCNAVLYKVELERQMSVCPKCDHHMRISARKRIDRFLDQGEKIELGEEYEAQDILKFKDSKKYKDRLSAAQKNTGEKDALVVMKGELQGMPVVVAAFEFGFLGGSMASVVGARFVKGVDYCLKHKIPLVCFSASGGARMQEGAYSLMQLAKTSSKLARFSKKGGLYIVIITDPTTGGISASIAMLGDIILAEPNSLICFAGPRVIKQTIGQDLPEGFQKSEFLLEKGFIDDIVHRKELKKTLTLLMKLLMKNKQIH